MLSAGLSTVTLFIRWNRTSRLALPFDCDFQGLWRDFSQLYGPTSAFDEGQEDCRWLDITDVLPGDYTLRVTVNPDGTLRDAELFRLSALHPRLGAIRFDGSLVFVNVAYFEEAILRLERQNPELGCVLVVSNGINGLDASGVEMISNLLGRLRGGGVTLAFSGIKRQVLEVMERSGLVERIGRDRIFPTDQMALDALRAELDARAPPPAT